MADVQLQAIYSSPLRRSLDTASLALESWTASRLPGEADGLTVTPAPELVEIDHGLWSGHTSSQVQKQWPQSFEQWQRNPAATRMPQGESLTEVYERASLFLASVRQNHPDGAVLVVTHGTVVRVLLTHFLELDLDRIWTFELENGALTIVEDRDPPLIMSINDNCHLKGVRSKLDVQVR